MQKTKKKLWVGLVLAGAASSLADRAGAADLTVEIANIRSSEGHIMIAVYDSEDGFLSRDSMKVGMKLPADSSGVSHTFEGLEAGTYAVSVFHDKDDDGKLDRNFMGIPKEPYGMSQGARGRFGPPKFTDAAFELAEPDSAQKIALN